MPQLVDIYSRAIIAATDAVAATRDGFYCNWHERSMCDIANAMTAAAAIQIELIGYTNNLEINRNE